MVSTNGGDLGFETTLFKALPTEARWAIPRANARRIDIGRRVDVAMMAIEPDNATLGV